MLFHSIMFIMGAIIRTDFIKYPNLLMCFSWLIMLILYLLKYI